jgi:NADH:ubiquinone oxidoreductase subunit F (NADH-binding)
MSLLLEWARRRAAVPGEPGTAITDFLDGLDAAEVARRRGLPAAATEGIRTFYDQLDRVPRVCSGTSCYAAGAAEVHARLAASGPVGDVRCLGHCYDPPAIRVGDTVCAAHALTASAATGGREATLLRAEPAHLATAVRAVARSQIPRRSLADPPAVLRHLIAGAATDPFEDYELPDGASIMASIERSGLRGRGGAAFSTGAKWRVARDTPAAERWVVANGDEGDPGSFVDRLLLEESPHAVLAGMVACGRAIGARQGLVYIRAEYPRAQTVMRGAIDEARARGFLNEAFDVEVVPGAGSYVCGEETALLNSIEGLRGEPRVRPPYPAQAGLFGMPTVVQNVETLAVVAPIARRGIGGGTKAVSVAGAVQTPGVVEIVLGTPLDRVLHEGAGGPAAGRTWRMALVGGPMGRVVPASAFGVPLSFEALPGMGHAGVVVLDDTIGPGALAQHLAGFARAESCGNCTPCRVGTARLADLFTGAGGPGASGPHPSRVRADVLARLLDTLEIGSLCGFGQGVPRPFRDLVKHYGDEVLA